MKIDTKYFKNFNFTEDQIKKNLQNAIKDFEISNRDKILEVKFGYAYTALIKAGIALLSCYKTKIMSVPGHHIKIIEKTAEILKDKSVIELGDAMRSKRNLDFYSGGIEITEKECDEYIEFVDKVIKKIQKIVLQ